MYEVQWAEVDEEVCIGKELGFELIGDLFRKM